MADFDPGEEKTLLYVLGEMSTDDARQFEARMEESPELMERVKELEEGAVALARTCPPKRAPGNVWSNIEKAIEKESRVIVRWDWFRNKGWAAAAACLAGWLIYALAVHQASKADRDSVTTLANGNQPNEANGSEESKRISARNNSAIAAAHNGDVTNVEAIDPRAIESETLRKQVGELQRQVASISQSLTQQQALLNDPTRLKFVGLAPASNGPAIASTELSPQLQRALALAMARELGWLGNSNVLSPGSAEDFWRGATTNIGGVDFIDLRAQSPTNSAAPMSTKSALEFAQPSDSNPSAHDDQSKPAGLLPAFASNDHVTVALDNSIAPPGSQITLTGSALGGSPQFIGTTTIGNNPTVITFNSLGGNGDSITPSMYLGGGESWIFTVNSVTPGGVSNQLQFVTMPSP